MGQLATFEVIRLRGSSAAQLPCGQQKSRPPFPAPGAILRISFRRLNDLPKKSKQKNTPEKNRLVGTDDQVARPFASP